MNTEYIKYGDGKKCNELMQKYPDYKVYWRSGWGYRGASELLLDKQASNFNEEMKRKYNWTANITINIDHESQELHFNGLSCLDME